MDARTPARSALLLALVLTAACGGAPDPADEASGAEHAAAAPSMEAPPSAEGAAPAGTTDAASATRPSEPRPTVSARPTRPAPAEDAGPAIHPDAGTPDAEPESAPVRAVTAGTALEMTLDAALSTESTEAGDRFSARLASSVQGADGSVLLPLGATVRGTVIESRESPSADSVAVIRLRVDEIVVDGRTLPLVAVVEDVQIEAAARDRNRETVGKVAVGAAAGALLGRVVGSSARRGAVVGAAAGAAVAIVTRDGQATIPAGSRMTVRLAEPLVLS